MYIGDFKVAAVIDLKFTTRSFTTGAPTTLAGTPAISIYKDNDTTQTTTGITLSVDFDGVTGLNNIHIDTSNAFYAAGSNFQCIITTGTVGGVSVVGETVGAFSIEATSALRPTTAGRTLDVSATGEAGVDWANIGGPTTANVLSNTTISAVTNAVGSVTGNVGGNLLGSVSGSVAGSVASVSGNVGGNVVGSVGSVVGLTASNLDATISSRATPAQILTTALTEAYAADGAAGTLAQILFGIQSFLQERSVSGVTQTCKKLDGATTSMTFTLDSAVTPTSITRAT